MNVTDILRREHRVIEQVLDCLEQMVARVRTDHALPREDAAQAIEFLRTFADRCHHGKEEGQLFPAMTKKGIPDKVGPIAVMLEEHETGRAAVNAMGAAVEAGDSAAFARSAEGFIELLREHIAKEDNILFPMAESVFSGEENEVLTEGFERFETDDMTEGVHEKMLAIADRLATSYGVALAADRVAGPFTGCCHSTPADTDAATEARR